jgi:hypothetical protein
MAVAVAVAAGGGQSGGEQGANQVGILSEKVQPSVCIASSAFYMKNAVARAFSPSALYTWASTNMSHTVSTPGAGKARSQWAFKINMRGREVGIQRLKKIFFIKSY